MIQLLWDNTDVFHFSVPLISIEITMFYYYSKHNFERQ